MADRLAKDGLERVLVAIASEMDRKHQDREHDRALQREYPALPFQLRFSRELGHEPAHDDRREGIERREVVLEEVAIQAETAPDREAREGCDRGRTDLP